MGSEMCIRDSPETAVELDHENAAVSGYAQTRTLKTGKAHLLRWHDAATKKYLTHADALERGHLAADARALPLRSAHVDVLRMLRPLLWRLEHVALVEDAAAQPVDVTPGVMADTASVCPVNVVSSSNAQVRRRGVARGVSRPGQSRTLWTSAILA